MADGLSSANRDVVERRIRIAPVLISLGLLALLPTLVRIPLAFVAYAGITCPLVLAGIVLFLYSIIAQEAR